MYEIEQRTLEPHPTLTMHGVVAAEDIPDFLGKAYEAVYHHAGTIHAGFAGPPFARYRPLDDSFSKFEVEAGAPTFLVVEGAGDVVASELPGGQAVVTVHIGPYEQMTLGYEALAAWLAEHGATADSPPWEVCLTDPNVETDPAKWRTEIIQPYRTA